MGVVLHAMHKRIEAHRDFMASWVKLKLEQKPILAVDRESLSCYPVDDLGLYMGGLST